MFSVNEHLRALKNATDAGDAEAAAVIRQRLLEAQQASDRAEYDPTTGMSGGQKIAANLGAGASDWILGAKQLFGRASGEDAREKAELDRRLADATTGGGLMQFAGAALPAVLPGLAPLANSVRGAALIGGVTGAMMPTQADNVALGKFGQTATGAALGGAAQKYMPGAIKWGANKVDEKATALADAMARRGLGTAGRRASIAERTFVRSVEDPKKALRSLTTYRDVPGTRPTTSQIINERPALEIERKLRDSGGQAAQELGAARNASNQARYKFLRDELDADPEKLWDVARDFAEQSKGKMRVLKGGIDPRGTLIREAGRLRNSYDNPRAQAVMQEIQDRLKVALQKQGADQLDSLHKLRMYEIDDRLDSLMKSDKKLAKAIGKDLVGFKKALDRRLNEGLKGNAAWDDFLTGYSGRAREAGWADSGSELLGRIDNLTPTSTGEPNLASGRTLIRNQVGATDRFGNPKYSPLAEDALRAVDQSIDVEMRPLAPDIRPAGSATGANVNRQVDAATRTLEPMMRGFPQAPNSMLPQAAGYGSVAGAVANPAAAVGTAAATMAAGGARNAAQRASSQAAMDIAQRLFAHYRDPQVAMQALKAAIQQQQVPPAIAMQAAIYLTRLGAPAAAGVAAPAALNAAY